MTKQLTKEQIAQLRVFLADYGLNVTPKKASKEWAPKTAAGRACKARMAMWAKLPKAQGVTSCQVRDRFGEWLSPDHQAFDNAVAYRKAQDAKDLQAARMRNEFLSNQ